MDFTILLLIGLVLLLAAFARATIGFGDGMLAMPILAAFCGVRFATPLVALASVTIAGFLLLRSWKQVDWPVVIKLFASSALGLPAGFMLLRLGAESLLKLILGLLLTGYGGLNLIGFRTARPSVPPGWIYPCGMLAGLLGGAYNMQGIPIVIYASLAGWTPTAFRAILQVYFLGTSVLIAAGHGLVGLWTEEVIISYLYTIPVLTLGVVTGARVSSRISVHGHQRLVNAAIVLLGLSLVIGAVLDILNPTP
jgi:uncharacterized membrane protein YfcA